MIIICDLDGTIADLDHRLPMIKEGNKEWDKFHDSCDIDTPILGVRAVLFALLHNKNQVIYVTGRPESSRTKTRAWLDLHKFPTGSLHMRPNGNYNHDYILKKEILYQDILMSSTPTEWGKGITKEDILCVLEDRDSVVKMWREEGLTCLQVKEGNY